MVETGAGQPSGFEDRAYAELDGVRVVERRSDALDAADMVAAVSPPTPDEARALPVEPTLLSFLPPAANVDTVAVLRDRQVTAFSFDLVPRTSRAQAMDALSSQAVWPGTRPPSWRPNGSTG